MALSVCRFQGWSDRYATFRPTYPEPLLRALSHSIIDEPPPAGGAVADVGSGTGIFTRQLRALLPDTVPILGIEPASDMRLKALSSEHCGARITYLDGTAENLPLEAGTVRAVVAATAAHWFDRPAFYKEAHRTLMVSGLLAIIDTCVTQKDRRLLLPRSIFSPDMVVQGRTRLQTTRLNYEPQPGSAISNTRMRT